MFTPIFHSIASFFVKKRIYQIELFIKYPAEIQLEVLNQLITFAKQTEIGKKYDFETINGYKTFSERLPIVFYEDIEHTIDKLRKGEKNIVWPKGIKWFAKSSGTTNDKSKFIPISNESLEECHYKSGKDLLSLYLNNNEDSKLFTGKNLRLGGSKELYQEKGTYFGDLSSILIDNLPFWAELSSAPGSKISLMKEWESKLDAIIKNTVDENITSLAGVPSWMLVLLNRLMDYSKKSNLTEIWPNIEVFFHGGVSFLPYKSQYHSLFPNNDFKYYEVYNASEGFFAIQDSNDSDEMLLMLDYGIFYEFIPMEAFSSDKEKMTPIPLWMVTTGINYAIVITTNGGLWRYIIGDTVRFTSTNPYRIKVSGRTKHHINVFGEEVIIENTNQAIKSACEKTNTAVVEYTVAPIFMKNKKSGGHEWLIEFKSQPKDLDEFMYILDNDLKALNSDYEAKRYKNLTLSSPKLHLAKKDLFHRWLKSKNKLGGQHKVPRLSNSRTYMDALLELNQNMD